MKKTLALVLTLSSVLPVVAAAEPLPDDLGALLRRQTQALMDAIAPGDVDVWQRYLLDDVVYLDEDGGVSYDKASLLRDLKPLPPGLVGRIEVDRFALTQHGETAVVAGEIQEHLEYHGQPLRTRFSFLDTWLRTPDGWRLAARHTAAVLKDPPAIALSRKELCAYAGTYRLTDEILTTVRCDANGLVAERTGRSPETLQAEVRDVFFVAGRPRSRRIFLRQDGKVVAFVDRREGEDIRWRRVPGAEPRRARGH